MVYLQPEPSDEGKLVVRRRQCDDSNRETYMGGDVVVIRDGVDAKMRSTITSAYD